MEIKDGSVVISLERFKELEEIENIHNEMKNGKILLKEIDFWYYRNSISTVYSYKDYSNKVLPKIKRELENTKKKLDDAKDVIEVLEERNNKLAERNNKLAEVKVNKKWFFSFFN